MQGEYADLTKDIYIKYGQNKRISSALDIDHNTGRFVQDPANVPSIVFNTRQSVQDMVTAAGPDVVAQSGDRWIAQKIEGKTSKEVTDFIKTATNSGWLPALYDINPTLKGRLSSYISDLQRSELRTAGLAEEHTSLSSTILQRDTEALSGREKTLSDAEKRAISTPEARNLNAQKRIDAAMKASERNVSEVEASKNEIIKSDTPIENMVDHIRNDPERKFQAVAEALKNDPNGKARYAEAIHGALFKLSPSEITQVWDTKLKAALTNSGIATPAKIAEIQQGIDAIELAYKGNPAMKYKALRKYLIATVGGLGGKGVSESVSKDYDDAQIMTGNRGNNGNGVGDY